MTDTDHPRDRPDEVEAIRARHASDDMVYSKIGRAPMSKAVMEPHSDRATLLRIVDEQAAALLQSIEGGIQVTSVTRSGIYVASRVKHAVMWQAIRSDGAPIISTWIDEAGEGETGSFAELWSRIQAEVTSARSLIFYAEASDFPFKGALVEVGMALAAGVPVYLVLAPNVKLEDRTLRPLGSWAMHPLVTRCADMRAALVAALSRPSPRTDAEIAPADLVEGKLYQCRNGAWVGPLLRQDSSVQWPWFIKGVGSFDAQGRFNGRFPHANDLMSSSRPSPPLAREGDKASWDTREAMKSWSNGRLIDELRDPDNIPDRYKIDLMDAAAAALSNAKDEARMMAELNEAVNHPDHYGGETNPYETIKVIEAWDLGFHLGNAVKYISRAGKKNREDATQDLRKAAWYLQREISRLERTGR